MIFKIDEKKREVEVRKSSGPAETYDDFAGSLLKNDCRYAVYDFDFVTSENCQKSKIFFIAWLVPSLFLAHNISTSNCMYVSDISKVAMYW